MLCFTCCSLATSLLASQFFLLLTSICLCPCHTLSHSKRFIPICASHFFTVFTMKITKRKSNFKYHIMLFLCLSLTCVTDYIAQVATTSRALAMGWIGMSYHDLESTVELIFFFSLPNFVWCRFLNVYRYAWAVLTCFQSGTQSPFLSFSFSVSFHALLPGFFALVPLSLTASLLDFCYMEYILDFTRWLPPCLTSISPSHSVLFSLSRNHVSICSCCSECLRMIFIGGWLKLSRLRLTPIVSPPSL